MDRIFALHNDIKNPEFIGHDKAAHDIIDIAISFDTAEYDQQNTTRYYEALRWSVFHLANNAKEAKNYQAVIDLIRRVLKIKNTNNTFIVKLISQLIGKIKNQGSVYQNLIDLCNEIIQFCDDSNNFSMKNRIRIRLCQLHLVNQSYKPGLELVTKTLLDLKKYDDNLGQIEIQLIESKIHYATMGIAKCKAALTSVKALCTKVYIEPYLQADIDFHSGVVALHEKDYNLSYSYFYESLDTFNIPTVKKPKKALRAFKLMTISKIMNGNLDEINGIIYGKIGSKQPTRTTEALKKIETCTRQKSVKALKEYVEEYKDVLLDDEIITKVLHNLHNEILEKNLVKIIEPYSVLEISFIEQNIALSYEEIQNKLSQMILDKKINGILDQGRGSLILYDDVQTNTYLEKTLNTFKNLEKVVESLNKKVRNTNFS